MNDILNKDKFFVAIKFSDLDRKVWIRTRVSMKNEAIFETKIPILREWTLLEKAIETSLPMVGLHVDKLKSLFKYRKGKALPTSLTLSPSESFSVEMIIAKLLYFFQHKFCISQKISGTVLAVQTTSAKKQASLNTYFHEKHSPRLPYLWPQILKIEPVSWEILKKMNKSFVKPGEASPIGLNINPAVDPFYKRDPRVVGMEEPEIMSQDLNLTNTLSSVDPELPNPIVIPPQITGALPMPQKRGLKRFSIPNAAKVFIKFKQGQREYHGWQKPKYAVEWNIPKITQNLLTIVVKSNGLYWLNSVQIEPKETNETSDDLIEDFEARLVQYHFPFTTDRKWVGIGNLQDMPKALLLPRKVMLDFIGVRLGGARLFRSLLDRVRSHMVDFIGKHE